MCVYASMKWSWSHRGVSSMLWCNDCELVVRSMWIDVSHFSLCCIRSGVTSKESSDAKQVCLLLLLPPHVLTWETLCVSDRCTWRVKTPVLCLCIISDMRETDGWRPRRPPASRSLRQLEDKSVLEEVRTPSFISPAILIFNTTALAST